MSLLGLLRKKDAPDRYAGKPFLKLVDSFVLKGIGELDLSQEALLQQLTPKLQQTFKYNGTWEEIVMSELRFGPEIRAAISSLWAKNQGIAKQNGTTLTPMQFVEMFVDNNVTNS